MIKRTIEISQDPMHICVRDEQLRLYRKQSNGAATSRTYGEPAASIPCEDIGVLMVDQKQATYTHQALASLANHGAAVVICGRDHQPVAMCLPLSRNSQLLARLDAQLHASKPTTKRLWKQIVSAKVKAQADALPPIRDVSVERGRAKLLALARRVRSGDPDNIEAQAAAVYWPLIFRRCESISHPFRRSPQNKSAKVPNNLLDYGYATMRAAVARSIVSAGLLPAIGIKHIGRSNPFCLADDLMEPLRPLVDRRVRWLAQRGDCDLDQLVKAELLGILTDEVECSGSSGPLMVTLSRYVASFVRVLLRESDKLEMPTFPERDCG